MLQCAYLLYLSFSLGGFGRLHLSLSSSSPTSALANRGQSCPRHGFLGYHDHPCFLHMRLWALAWASGPVQEMDADYWALWPHNSPSKFYCLAPRTERRILMSLGIPQAYYVLSSAGISAFLTAQGMLLKLRHLERALLNSCDRLPYTFYGAMAIQWWSFFCNSRRENSRFCLDLGINIHLNQFAQITFAFKSSCAYTLNLPIFSLIRVSSKACSRTISSFL